MNQPYKSYAHLDLPIGEIKKYAEQYEGVNMWEVTGNDENSSPFLIWNSEEDFLVMFWTKHTGLMAKADDDPVRNYAFAIWLKENGFPVFSSFEEANRYVDEHEWPRS